LIFSPYLKVLYGGEIMSEERAKRKLSGILSADAVGYSRLMEEDEAMTIHTLEDSKRLMSELIQQFKGRVVDAPGDNLLAEFGSVVDATDCAVKIQQELKTKNAALPDNRKMHFRIGVNLGDVVEEADRIYGDGINIAARIEGLAEPGGVCISRTVYDHVKNKLALGYEYLGEHSVKNIAEPVRVYRVLTEPEAAGKVIGEKRFLGRISRKTAMAAIIGLVIVAGGLIGWNIYLQQSKKIEPASVEKMAYPLPDKPSIAVLPFDNMSGDSEQEYFCDGLTEEIITSLSKVPKLFVIARNSTFTYKGKPVKVQQVSEELGVRYVLEGSVRKVDNQLRITAQLIDAIKGHHLWSERYDRELKDILAVQDEITMKITTGMGVTLTTGEQARLSARGTTNLDAYLKCLEAREHIFRLNRDSNLIARQRAEEAIALDPEYSFAYSLLGKTHLLDVWFKWSKSPKESLMRAFELAKKALALDESNSGAHLVFAIVFLFQRLHDKAIVEGERAVSLAPNAADAINILGQILRFAGRPREAAPMHERAIRLNPMPPAQYFYQLALCYTFIGEYEKAIAICKKALHKNPDDFVGRLTLTIAYSALGRDEEARSEATEALRIHPKFALEYASKTWPYKNDADRDFVLNALRKAGLK
jgi:adenylate cyclase